MVSEGQQSNRLLGQLWSAVKVAGGAKELAERPCPSTYVLQGGGAYQLAKGISADSAKDPELGRTFSSYASELGFSADEWLRRGRERSSEGSRTVRPRRSRFQLNLLRGCGASLKSAAAGIRCWGCFCDEAAKPHVLPTEEGVLARPSFFGDRRSFKIYVASLEKACLLLGIDAS